MKELTIEPVNPDYAGLVAVADGEIAVSLGHVALPDEVIARVLGSARLVNDIIEARKPKKEKPEIVFKEGTILSAVGITAGLTIHVPPEGQTDYTVDVMGSKGVSPRLLEAVRQALAAFGNEIPAGLDEGHRATLRGILEAGEL